MTKKKGGWITIKLKKKKGERRLKHSIERNISGRNKVKLVTSSVLEK